jgi:uncharacterized radical SAM superfamily Fe-S cluster-containing enzyme
MLLLRGMRGLIRFILIELERSPSAIMSQFAASGGEDAAANCEQAASADPMELLSMFEEMTGGEISQSDFFPASVGCILEPFIALMGMGSYNIRPSPFCGFATLLINSDTLHSVPLSRLLDVEKLYSKMVPLLPKLRKSGASIGLTTGLQLKEIVKKCRKSKDLPELLSYASAAQGSEKWNEAQSILDNL